MCHCVHCGYLSNFQLPFDNWLKFVELARKFSLTNDFESPFHLFLKLCKPKNPFAINLLDETNLTESLKRFPPLDSSYCRCYKQGLIRS